MEITLVTIETLAKKFAGSREILADHVAALNLAIEDLKRRALPAIKRQVAATAADHAALTAAIEGGQHLFIKPRTVILHGIKVGMEKGKGAIEIEDEERTIKLIRKNLPEQAEALIKSEEWVPKAGLKNLTVAELKSIGCTVEETGDQVVIRPVDREVDKLVNALLKAATEEVPAPA